MTGREILEAMDIPIGQYRLSVKVADDSERVGVPTNFSPNSIEYRCVLKRDEPDDTMVFPFYCGSGLKSLETEDFSITEGEDSPFHRLVDFLNTLVCDTLDESLSDFDNFCDELGYDAEVEDDNGNLVRNASAFETWKKLNAFREMVQQHLPFETLQDAMYYGVRYEEGGQLILPETPSSGDNHVSLLLQAMLNIVEYIDQNGTSRSVQIMDLNPALKAWLSKEIGIEHEVEITGMER